MREIVARYAHARDAGHQVTYVSFARDDGGAGPGVATMPRRKPLAAVAGSARHGVPLQVGFRTPDAGGLDRTIAALRRRRWPRERTVVISEQFVTLGVGAALAEALGVCLVHRTHNDEPAYARYVARCERRRAHRAVLRAEAALVRRHVARWVDDARLALVAHISADSAAAWTAASRHDGGGDQLVLPPCLPSATVPPNPATAPFRAVYVGTLDLPQNAAELRRFLESAWSPFVSAATGPRPVLRIAGRGATEFARTLAPSLTASLEVVGGYDDAATVLAGCDVAVNPALGGSGVSIKTIEYLAHGLPVVSGPAGFRGIDVPGGVLTPAPSLLVGLQGAAHDRAALAGRRAALAGWYRRHLDPGAVLPPFWQRLAEVAAMHQAVVRR
jgi:glycosyltransferase involved in cell wall biosynthesis